jgi:ATP-binding cassette subfamily F protein 3
MLHVSNLDKYYAGMPVLRGVSFTLGYGDHTGIVGPNGSGKSTLLRIIAGVERPDAGAVSLTPNYSVGYLRQGFLDEGAAAGERRLAAVLDADGAVWPAHAALQEAAEQLAVDPRDSALMRRYEEAATLFEDLGGYPRLSTVEEVLEGLGLAGLAPERPIDTLSGGQKTRLALGALLLTTPDVLLLDEPTNHLDVDALRWLEAFITRYDGSVLLVSHDRAFLDATVTTVLELSDETHTVTSYAGGYTAYAAATRAAREARWEGYKRQERERKRVEADIREVRSHALHTERLTRDSSARRLANKVMRTAIVRERKLEKQLSAHAVEKPVAGWNLKLDFAPAPGGAREVVRAAGLHKSFGGHRVLDGVDLHLRHGERVVLTGPNGGGKTTLLKIIAGELAPDEGTVVLGANVVLGYFGQEQEGLDPRRSPLEAVRAATPLPETEARTLLHRYLFEGDEVFTPIERLSYGERARLVLALLVLSGANLLLLDEPTNHLDIPSRERFEAALATYHGTVLAVLHDRYAIERLATRVLELRDGALRTILGE